MTATPGHGLNGLNDLNDLNDQGDRGDRGDPHDLQDRHDLRLHAQAAPGRPFVVCDGHVTTYGQAEAMANRLAAVWRGLGLSRGDHVAVLMANRAELLVAGWAAWRTGVYLTPMSTALTAGELRYLVQDSGARVVIADTTYAATAAELMAATGGARHWLSIEPRGEVPAAAGAAGPGRRGIAGYTAIEPLLEAASPQPRPQAESPGALMLYTSGTTGAPKGVWRPLPPADFRGTPTFAGDLLTQFPLAGGHVRYLSTAPLYHAAGIRFALAVTAGGGTVVAMPRFDAAAALDLLERHAITVSQWVPAMFLRLLALPAERRARFAAPAHGCAIHAAAPCPPELKRRMLDWWGPVLLEYYAGTEGVGMTKIDSHEWLRKPGSVGRACRGTLHVVAPEGHDLGPGETGLVCFSGLPAFEYHHAPEKTAARQRMGADGVLRQTLGDIGHVDADGYLFLTDRADDMIISGGVNVYPQEIEAALRQVSGVWDCAAVGVPDERFGERPVAFVVPAAEVTNRVALLAEIEKHCERHLGRIKRPDALFLVDELPRLPTGKVLRRRLREMTGAAQPDEPAAPSGASRQRP